ncbi:MAG: metallophosphoesterase [Bryobacteraceae bacterium]|nr:metallophosphoesterase [Bryobacteraceae bacterium]
MTIVWRFLPDLGALLAGGAAAVLVQRWFLPRFPWLVYAGLALIGVGTILNLRLLLGATPAQWEVGLRGLAYAFAAVCVATLPIALLVRHRLRQSPPPDPRRRQLLQAAVAAPLATMGFGLIAARFVPRVIERDIVIPGLPRDLHGLRLGQISDIHLSPFLSRQELARAVHLLNETKPDIALVTGDLITGSRDPIDACLAELSRLKATGGVYGCHGNHEMYIGAEPYVTAQAARYGMRFLRSQRESLRFGQAKLNLAGVDYQPKGKPMLRGARGLVAPGEFNLLLSHTPEVFPTAQRQGWDLIVSGHTHGGQLNLELFGEQLNLVRLFTPYTYGYFEEGRSRLWVTRGLGTVGIPARLGAPPEVVVLRLVAA